MVPRYSLLARSGTHEDCWNRWEPNDEGFSRPASAPSPEPAPSAETLGGCQNAMSTGVGEFWSQKVARYYYNFFVTLSLPSMISAVKKRHSQEKNTNVSSGLRTGLDEGTEIQIKKTHTHTVLDGILPFWNGKGPQRCPTGFWKCSPNPVTAVRSG